MADSKENKQVLDITKPDPLDSQTRAMMLQSESSVWLNVAKFEQMNRVATMLSKTDFIPAAFKDKPGNCMIALDLAERMDAHPIMLMQTMYVVHGRPGFEGKFVSALVNNSGRYTGKLKYQWKGEQGNPEWGCRAWAILKGSEERVNGPWVDWKMVVAEGWNKAKQSRSGGAPIPSKWTTLPELMFMYRAASFFGKTHDSDLLMGMSTIEEIEDEHAIAMVQKPDGSFDTPAEIKTGQKPKGLYDAKKNPPDDTKTPEKTETIQEDPEYRKDQNAMLWDYENWRSLKKPGMVEFAETNRDAWPDASPEIQKAFHDKWQRICSGIESPLEYGQQEQQASNDDEEDLPPDMLDRYNELLGTISDAAFDYACQEAGCEKSEDGIYQKPIGKEQTSVWMAFAKAYNEKVQEGTGEEEDKPPAHLDDKF